MNVCNKKAKIMSNTTLIKNSFPAFLISPRYRVLRHVFLILFFFFISFAGNNSDRQYVGMSEWIIRSCFIVFCLGIVYVNMYVLVPRFLFKDRYWLYLGSVLLLIACTFSTLLSADSIINLYRIEPKEVRSTNTLVGFLSFTFVVGVYIAASTAIKLLQKWLVDSQRVNELEKLTLEIELEQLKNQINPHFLFNMLNNINILILKSPEKASHILMVLSDLLRYQLYDTTRTKVFLTSDIDFIKDFLNLESIRRDNFSFDVRVDGEIENVLIAPLLFIPFVENATKHNTYGEKLSYVNVHFSMNENYLHFYCENSKPKFPDSRKEKGGLGLNNIKRRLELLYPNTHELSISDNETNYIVNLSINL